MKPPVRSADLICADEPKGYIPRGSSVEVASERIVGISESGEDCRQVVRRSHDKMEVYENIVDQLNKQTGVKVVSEH